MNSEKKKSSKRRSLENGRDLLARYKASHQNMESKQTGDPSDDDLVQNENAEQSLDHSTIMTEDTSFKDTTQSSISVSEGEGDGDVECMAGRVAKLKEVMHGRKAMIQMLTTEYENIRDEAGSPSSSHSQNSSTQYKDIVDNYKSKLKDFDRAVTQRDTLISSLKESLEKTIADRDALRNQLSALRSINVSPQDIDGPIDIQKRISDLELALGTHVELVKTLNVQLSESHECIKQLKEKNDKHDEEVETYKDIIYQLNEKIKADRQSSINEAENIKRDCKETVLKIQKDMQNILDKFANETKSKHVLHEKEIQELRSKHEVEVAQIKQHYEEQYKSLFERYNSELPELESKHAKELQVFQSQAITYKKTIEAFESEVENYNKLNISLSSELNSVKRQLIQCREDRDMMKEQIQLHKVQIDELTAKYVAASSVLNSRESIERSLEEALLNVETLKRENDDLKCRYDDISAKFAAFQAIIENNHINERSMNQKSGEIDKSLSRFSGMSLSEFNTTSYPTFDDAGIQFQIFKQRLDEKESLEKKLIDKVNKLEETLKKVSKELEEVNVEKKSYEKELKETKNKCEKMMSELKSYKESNCTDAKPFPSNIYFSTDFQKMSKDYSLQQDVDADKINESYEKQIDMLKQVIQQKDLQYSEVDNKLKHALEKLHEYKTENKQLAHGLQNAWAACAAFENKMDQTLKLNVSNLDESETLILTCNDLVRTYERIEKSSDNRLAIPYEKSTNHNSSLSDEYSSQNLEQFEKKLDYFHTRMEMIDQENQKLKEQNAKLITLKEELEKCHKKEVEELRTYFEEKCVQIEKQYSEEIFSQQSKKMSDDSEVDEMADDLFCGGGEGDCINDRKETNGNIVTDATEGCQDKATEIEDINRNSFITTNQLCQTEWDTAVENGELLELRAAYNQQLEEQIALAKRDIVNALQEQVQALIAVEGDAEENWPPELLELRNKFTNNAKRETEKLKETHQLEIFQLKEEHSRNLAKTVESYKEKISKLISERDIQIENNSRIDNLISEKDVVKQRDTYYQICIVFKDIIRELIQYFTNCEEELNNTLVSEVFKRLFDKNEEAVLIEENIETAKLANVNNSQSSKMTIKRVHFAPRTNQLTTILKKNTDIPLDLINDKSDLLEEIKVELEKCFQRLKSESAQIFGHTLVPGESISEVIAKQLSYTTKINEELASKLFTAESTNEQYEEEIQDLKRKYVELQQKCIIMDNSKEIISEGYGEQDTNEREPVIQDYNQLYERARIAIMNGVSDTSYLLQLIDDLCRHHDKQTEERKKEKEDLQQQLEGADKQLRATRKFLEEQASEREIERDDATRQIQVLKDQLKERDREKERDLRITSEYSPTPELPVTPLLQVQNGDGTVEALELQLREMSVVLSNKETEKAKVEADLEDAVGKIWELRDIITSLESEIEMKIRREEELKDHIERKNEMESQRQELIQELETRIIAGEMSDHITHLQEELRRHKLNTEDLNVNSTALKQMKTELQEMVNLLDRKTKELEALHMCESNLSLSHPSEDVSVQDQIDSTRCPTPDDCDAPPTLPLDQLLKLKEKLIKHTRTEEVAFKRIKDLDIQLSALKIQNEELLAEQEILQQHNSDQLFQIETMRGRLEQQKQSAPFAQRQATSKLELQLHEANAKFHSMEQILANKDIMLKEVTSDLDHARQLLREKQEEIHSKIQAENKTIQELKTRIEVLEHEKEVLETNLKTQERKNLELQKLFDSMLLDKNDEIDRLKEQFLKLKLKYQEAFNSQQIDDNNGGKDSEPKNSARTLSGILSIHSECEEIIEAIRETPKTGRDVSHNISNVKFAGLSTQTSDNFDGSSNLFIDSQRSPINVPPLELNNQPSNTLSPQHTSQLHFPLPADSIRSDSDSKSPVNRSSTISEEGAVSPLQRSQNSTHNQKSDKATSGKFQLLLVGSSGAKPSIEDLENQLKAIHTEFQAKSATLSKREKELDSLQKRLDELRAEYKDSMDTLTRDKVFYKNQYELSQESESKIKKDLEEVENVLKVTNDELETYKAKIQTNEKILHEVQVENATLNKDIRRLRDENRAYQITIREKIEELKNLKQIIFEKDITIETFKTRNEEIENENKQLYEFKTKYESNKKNLVEMQNERERLVDGINKRNGLIQKLEDTVRRSSLSGNCTLSDKDQLIIHQEELMKEKDKENHYNQELIKEKEKEIHHLQEYIKEKDKVIKQMSDDSKSLQRSLETIQSKMKETGNVVELRKKLKEERMYNDELTKMVRKLKRELEVLRDESLRQETEGTEIEDMVKRELNLSANLDQKILEAIDNDLEVLDGNNDNSHQSLKSQPIEKDLEVIMREYTEIRRKLKQANKVNENLNYEKNFLEVQQEILKSKVTEYENRILQIKADFETEFKKNVNLTEDLLNKKAMVHKLEILLQNQSSKFNFSQQESTDIIRNLRLKLTSSLDSENDLRKELTDLRQRYKILESKLKTLHEFMGPEQKVGISTSPVLKEDVQNTLLLTQKYEKVAREVVELTDTLKGIEVEKARTEKQLELEVKEREKLVSKIISVEEMKEHLEVELKRTKEQLKNSQEECDWLQKKIRIMKESEEKLESQKLNDQYEVKNLRKEINHMRDIMDDLSADSNSLKQELFIAQTEQKQSVHVIQALRKIEHDLQKKLTASKKEIEKLKDVIADLQSELETRCRRDLELSKELLLGTCHEKNNNTHLIEKISELTAEIARYSSEKGILYDKLIRAREETEKYAMKTRELETLLTQSENNEADSDTIVKLQQLHARYLRVDSKRKALIFQKRYLLCVIGGYQLSGDETMSMLAKLTNSERSYVTEKTLNVVTKCPKARFRSAVLVLVALSRIKWMIQRWKQGKRRNANHLIENSARSYIKVKDNASPMSREKRRLNKENSGAIDFDHYAQRFFTINKTLGLAMSEPEIKIKPFK